jgi:Mg/Co/Ni transporter MgtE
VNVAVDKVLIDKQDVVGIHIVGIVIGVLLLISFLFLWIADRYKDKDMEVYAGIAAVFAAVFGVMIPLVSLFTWPW